MHLLQLRDVLKDQLEKKGRWSWASEEFERLEGTKWAPDDPSGAFMKIKGARDLTRRELALMREVTQWRDAAAHALDRSTFRVVANEVLLDISRRAPKTLDDLGAIKGMPRGILERQGREVLDAVERGLAVPEAQLPKFPKSARWDKDPEFDDKVGRLKAVRDAAATRLELDPGVLCSRERLETIARKLPREVADLADIPGLRKWQVAEMGADFVKALSGFKEKATPPQAMLALDDSPYLDK
jgi:ribonuclease D